MMQELEEMIVSRMESILGKYEEKYGYSSEELIREMLSGSECISKEKKVVSKKVEVEVKKVEVKKVEKENKKILYPFSGVKLEGCCEAIKANYGLNSQCTNKKTEGSLLCTSCSKKGAEFGMIQERIDAGASYKDKKGKASKPYVTIMAFLKITEEEVRAKAKEEGILIDEIHFEGKKKVVSEGKKVLEKKVVKDKDEKRGRPKKDEKTVDVEAGEDIFATLMKEAKKVVEEELEEEEEEVKVVVEDVKVKKFEHNGKQYFKSPSTGLVFDKVTQEVVGKWNEETKTIDAYEEDEEEEEDEED